MNDLEEGVKKEERKTDGLVGTRKVEKFVDRNGTIS